MAAPVTTTESEPDGSGPTSPTEHTLSDLMGDLSLRQRASLQKWRTTLAAALQDRLSPREDPLKHLGLFNTVLVVDDSFSMGDKLKDEGVIRLLDRFYGEDPDAHSDEEKDEGVEDEGEGEKLWTRWDQLKEAILELVTFTERTGDSNSVALVGVRIHFLNSHRSDDAEPIKSPAEFSRLFSNVEPSGQSYTGGALFSLFEKYLKSISSFDEAGEAVKPMNVIILTDGEPTHDLNNYDPNTVIVNFARSLKTIWATAVYNNCEAGDDVDDLLLMQQAQAQAMIQFVLVGNSPKGRENLTNLDMNLNNCQLGEMIDAHAVLYDTDLCTVLRKMICRRIPVTAETGVRVPVLPSSSLVPLKLGPNRVNHKNPRTSMLPLG